jgi:hypothetical protein
LRSELALFPGGAATIDVGDPASSIGKGQNLGTLSIWAKIRQWHCALRKIISIEFQPVRFI